MQPLRSIFERTSILLALVSLTGCVTLPGRVPETAPVEEEPRLSSWENDETTAITPAVLPKKRSVFVTRNDDEETFRLVTQTDKALPTPESDYASSPTENSIVPPPLVARNSESAPTPAHLLEMPTPLEMNAYVASTSPSPLPKSAEGVVPTKSLLPILDEPLAAADLGIRQVGATMTFPSSVDSPHRASLPEQAKLSPSQQDLLRAKAESLEFAIRQRDRLLERATSEIREATSEVREARREMHEWTDDIKAIEERIQQREQEYLKTLRSMIGPLEAAAKEHGEQAKQSRWKPTKKES